MDYTGLNCPKCGSKFSTEDDIVVCPECGTPSHRHCYEALQACIYADKHSPDFSYKTILKEDVKSGKINMTFCVNCGHLNSTSLSCCKKCNFPLTLNNPSRNGRVPWDSAGQPVNTHGQKHNASEPPFTFDPLGGVPTSDQLADNISAGEMAKYVKTSIPYFLNVFRQIRCFGQSRFNFAAFLFSGGYFLFRKMYKTGAVIVALLLSSIVLEIYFTNTDFYRNFLNSFLSMKGFSERFNLYLNLTPQQYFFVSIPPFCQLLRYIIMFLCGVLANRTYYNHCIKMIKSIKENAKDSGKADLLLQTSGGVNSILGFLLFILFILLFKHIFI